MPETHRTAARPARRPTTALALLLVAATACQDAPIAPPSPAAPARALSAPRRESGDESYLTWYVARPDFARSGEFYGVAFGLPGDRPVPGSYTSAARQDVAVFRPSDGVWYVRRLDGSLYGVPWGLPTDSLVPADYDGDGRTDPAVWRSESGRWYVLGSAANAPLPEVVLGRSGDVPVPADYDGDRVAEPAVWRPGTGTWYLGAGRQPARGVRLGQAGDVPVPADYDGDGRTDLAVWRPSDGVWSVQGSRDGRASVVQFGQAGDVPVPADYDGDGRLDVAVWRPSDGLWYVRRADGSFYGVAFGQAGDAPLPGRYDGAAAHQYTAVRVSTPALVPSALTLPSGSSATLRLAWDGCATPEHPTACPPIRIRWVSENPGLVAVSSSGELMRPTTQNVVVTVVGTGPGVAVIKAIDDDTQAVLGASTITVPR